VRPMRTSSEERPFCSCTSYVSPHTLTSTTFKLQTGGGSGVPLYIVKTTMIIAMYTKKAHTDARRHCVSSPLQQLALFPQQQQQQSQNPASLSSELLSSSSSSSSSFFSWIVRSIGVRTVSHQTSSRTFSVVPNLTLLYCVKEIEACP